MEKQKNEMTLEPGMESSANNECEVALIRALLGDAKKLQQFKPSAMTDRNVRLAELFINNQEASKRAFSTSKSLFEMGI
ncbi:hypothetical protein [Serratia fonticola]|uniref:hypothetical protein n=1 Tax=Serratia fonticola TaxID=47917 RepID=UPI000938938D|nr:hypothetical protein [Serratia fonticola]OKP30945.1 hypothetical protein BSQ40_03220 [Serratia fonticola]